MKEVIIGKLKKAYYNNKLNRAIALCHANATIGHDFRAIAAAVIENESRDRSRIVIGHHTRLNGYICCAGPGKVEIGNYTVIQINARIAACNLVKIGSYCGIAEGALIVDNNSHPTEIEGYLEHRFRIAGEGYPGFGYGWELSKSAPIIIGDGVRIDGNTTILRGVTIGEGAIVARGTIVTKDVEPFTLVAGNPARVVRKLPEPDVPVSVLAEQILARIRKNMNSSIG